MGIGIRIKRILRERKMTIKQLSEESGVSLNTLYSITKRDSTRADPVIIQKVANALMVPVQALYDDKAWVKENSSFAKELSTFLGVFGTIYESEITPYEIKRLIEDRLPDFPQKLDTLCASAESIIQTSVMGSVLGDMRTANNADELDILTKFRGLNDAGAAMALEFMAIIANNPAYKRDIRFPPIEEKK